MAEQDKYAAMFQKLTGQTGITETQEETDIIDTSNVTERGLPTTNSKCSKCDNDTAYWYLQQIRGADESETRFFVCTKCEYRWRENDN
jgi:DNA-directed RNA polymerase subunit M